MTKEFEVEQDAEKAALLKNVVTAGAILKAAREAKGLSIEAVATQLHLRPRIISDIEQDIFENIASTTYVRGYIKNYARFVNADINEIQQCLKHQLPEIVPPAMQSFSRKTTHQARNSRLNLVTYFIITVLIAMLVIWWVQKSSLLTDVDVSLPTVEEIAADSAMPEPQQIIRTQEQNQNANVLTQAAADSGAELATLPANDGSVTVPASAAVIDANSTVEQATTNAVQPTTLPASTLNPASTSTLNQASAESTIDTSTSVATNSSVEGLLTIELSGDCWINVTDANGKVLVDGVKTAAKSVEVRGLKPFKVILGAPQVASISLDGSKVSLAEFANGRVARLTLPKA
ncbi:RodZ domain-containing protein [Shewanella litoralis]|uniref:Membrane protein n=1 Tax=Shewanella litoralis TaxID=2282700 RepID=A0ABQ2R4Q7_9GAMM|nr:RodZ domain-containing protein [Shewanella litoralis]GGQ13733.1 membrane protein [Shewanella litoralis]